MASVVGHEEERTRPARAAAAPPLCVELDEALVRTDTLAEQVLLLVRRRPLAVLRLLASRARGRGRAPLRRALAIEAMPDPALLPLDEDLVAWLREQKAGGRRIALVAAADQWIAEAVARRVGLFDWVLGSDGVDELVGARRLGAIQARLGEAFTWVGPAGGDPAVVAAASSLVRTDPGRAVAASLLPAPIEATFGRTTEGLGAWLAALRCHQWAKNLLVLVPVLLAGPLAGLGDLARAALAGLAFCLLASAGYVINDLLDLEADRRHPTKRFRPFAAGFLSLRRAGLVLLALLAAAGLATALLPAAFAPVAAGYLALTLFYSLRLKQVPLVDVVALGGLFSLRVMAGAEVIAAPLSYWLLTFSMFLFLSLAMVKRYAELDRLERTGGRELKDRGYATADLPLLLTLGLSASMAACVIFVIYLVAEQFPRAIYSRPGWLWLVFPILLLWVMRVWRLALHGKMDQDPVLFALKDRASVALGVAVGACLLLAW